MHELKSVTGTFYRLSFPLKRKWCDDYNTFKTNNTLEINFTWEDGESEDHVVNTSDIRNYYHFISIEKDFCSLFILPFEILR